MAQTLANLVVDLDANSSKLTAGLAKAEGSVKSSSARINRALKVVDKGFNSVTRTVGGVAKRMLSFNALIGTVAGSAGLGLLAKRSLDAADAIAKTADRTGLSTDALQEYRFAADRAGVSTATLDTGVEAFAKRLGELRQGTGALNTILKKLDPTLADLVKGAGSTDEALDLILRKMASLENASDRAALSAAAFGRTAGIGMANLVKDGAASLDEMRQRARDLGIVIDEKLLRQAETAKDRMTDLGTAIQSKVTAAMVSLAPQIERVADLLLTVFERTVRLFSQGRENELRNEIQGITEDLEKLGQTQKRIALDLQDPIPGLDELIARQRKRLEELQRELEGSPSGGQRTGPGTLPAPAPATLPSPIKDAPLQTAQIDAYNQALARSRQLFEETLLPIENYQLETSELRQLLDSGLISQETYNRALEATKKRLADAQARQDDFGGSVVETSAAMEEFKSIADSGANQLAGGLADAVVEGRKLRNVFQSLAKAIAKAVIQALILRVVTAGIAGFGGGGTVAAATAGGASGLGAGGGTLRFHTGGKVPGAGAVPIIAHAGEGIFTPKQMENADRLFARMAASSGQGGGNVIINNNTGTPIEQSDTRRTPEGDLEVTLDRAMARAATSGGAFSKALAEAGRITQR